MNYMVQCPNGKMISVEEYMKTDDYLNRVEKSIKDFLTNEKQKELIQLFK